MFDGNRWENLFVELQWRDIVEQPIPIVGSQHLPLELSHLSKTTLYSMLNREDTFKYKVKSKFYI